jgi:hypothetical protein
MTKTKRTRNTPATAPARPRMQDATLINIRSLKRRVKALEQQVKWLTDVGVRLG